MKQDKTYVCCICGKTYTGWGNNPYPIVIDETTVCCDRCNMEFVVPARIAELNKRRAHNEDKD